MVCQRLAVVKQSCSHEEVRSDDLVSDSFDFSDYSWLNVDPGFMMMIHDVNQDEPICGSELYISCPLDNGCNILFRQSIWGYRHEMKTFQAIKGYLQEIGQLVRRQQLL